MLKYRVKTEYLSGWTNAAVDVLIVDEREINRLAREWGMTVSALMQEVEEL